MGGRMDPLKIRLNSFQLKLTWSWDWKLGLNGPQLCPGNFEKYKGKSWNSIFHLFCMKTSLFFTLMIAGCIPEYPNFFLKWPINDIYVICLLCKCQQQKSVGISVRHFPSFSKFIIFQQHSEG